MKEIHDSMEKHIKDTMSLMIRDTKLNFLIDG